jgi:hypothetical protein
MERKQRRLNINKQRLRNSRVAGKGEQIRQQPWAKKKKKATKRDQRRIKVEK